MRTEQGQEEMAKKEQKTLVGTLFTINMSFNFSTLIHVRYCSYISMKYDYIILHCGFLFTCAGVDEKHEIRNCEYLMIK